MPDDEAAALADVADALYAGAPDEFVASRDARARELRAAGHRELARDVAALPRPTAAAWLLNQLARQRPDAVQQLVALGDELRAAQQNLDGDQLRALTRQRQQVVRAFARQAAQLADELGRPLSDAVGQQVEETLRAAVADEGAGQALLSGTLTTALTYVGMGSVDVSAAVAVPRARPTGRRRTERRSAEPDDELAAARDRRREAARTALTQAQQDAEAADTTLGERDDALRAASAEHERLAERLDALHAALESAQAEEATAAAEHRSAETAHAEAAASAERAHAAVEAAEQALEE